MSRTRGLRSDVRRKNDLYETPQWCIDLLAKEVPSPDHVIDMGAGDGRIGMTVARPGTKLTLLETHPPYACFDERWQYDDAPDYLENANAMELDGRSGYRLDSRIVPDEDLLIVSNPPFSDAERFVKSALKLLHRPYSTAIFLLRLNWLGSLRRADMINRYKPARISVLAPRPSFHSSRNDSCEYAWIWWGDMRGHKKRFFEVLVRKEE